MILFPALTPRDLARVLFPPTSKDFDPDPKLVTPPSPIYILSAYTYCSQFLKRL
jgi:hypothetical protein